MRLGAARLGSIDARFGALPSDGGLVDYFASQLDMNTAILLYLNDYYATFYEDIQAPFARYLRESTPNVQAQQKKLERRARGDAT